MDDSVLNWNTDQVASWLGTIGFDNFKKPFKDEGVAGDVLINLDHECLIDLSVTSVGKRIQLLKAIYELKLRYQLPIYTEDYLPPVNKDDKVNYQDELFGGYQLQDQKLVLALKERDAVIKHLVQEVGRLTSEVTKIRDDLRWTAKVNPNMQSYVPTKPSKNRPAPIVTHHTKGSPNSALGSSQLRSNLTPTTSSGYSNNQNLNVREDHLTLISPSSPNHLDPLFSASTTRSQESTPTSGDLLHSNGSSSADAIKVYGHRLQYRENEAYKSFRICLDDPCHKVIPAALRKYKIQDSWQHYSLYITQSNGTERKLDMDEKPLIIYQQLKDLNLNPVFVLKHNTKGKLVINSNSLGGSNKDRDQTNLTPPTTPNNTTTNSTGGINITNPTNNVNSNPNGLRVGSLESNSKLLNSNNFNAPTSSTEALSPPNSAPSLTTNSAGLVFPPGNLPNNSNDSYL